MIEMELKRIADSLERLVAYVEKPCKCGVPEPITRELPASVAKAKAPLAVVPTQEAKDERAEIKAELDKMGVKYNAKASTEALRAILEKTKTAVPENKAASYEKKTAGKPLVSAEEAKELLKNVSTKHGMDAARGLLKQLGVNKLSELDAQGNVALVNLITEFSAKKNATDDMYE